jgi:hypothetical protein
MSSIQSLAPRHAEHSCVLIDAYRIRALDPDLTTTNYNAFIKAIGAEQLIDPQEFSKPTDIE